MLCSFYAIVVWRGKTEYEHKLIAIQLIQVTKLACV